MARVSKRKNKLKERKEAELKRLEMIQRAPMAFQRPVVEDICARYAAGEHLKDILVGDGMPNKRMFYTWLYQSKVIPELDRAYFRKLFDQAKKDRAATLIDETVEISDMINHKWDAAAAKIKADVRFKYAAKVDPEKYGNLNQMPGMSGEYTISWNWSEEQKKKLGIKD